MSSDSSDEDLDDIIAQVETKNRKVAEEAAAKEAAADIGKALASMQEAGGEKTYQIKNKTLKGKKVDVPGVKGKHKINEEGTLTVGAMGLKIMDGQNVVASYLLQKLASWEATGNILRVAVDEKTWVEFTTDEGTQICEDILTIAKQLVTQKKADEKEHTEQKQAMLAARREQGARDFTVSQTFWKKKKKAKVPDTVQLNVGVEGIKISAELDDVMSDIETITIQNIVSWETVKDKNIFRLSVKMGALESDSSFAGILDFGTEEAESIKTVLLEVAQELAKKKKAERAARKEAEHQAAEEKARLSMKLEDTISDLYLETIGLCKTPDLSMDPYSAFDAASTAPESASSEDAPASWADELKTAVCHDMLLKVLLRLAWTKPPADDAKQPVMTAAATMLLTELLVESEKKPEMNVDADVVEAGCLALLNVAKIEANRSSIVSEGGIDLCVGWLEKHVESVPTCRAVTRVLVQLTTDEEGCQKLVDDKKTINRAITILLKTVSQHSATENTTVAPTLTAATVSTNPLFSSTVDVLEKALAVLGAMARSSPIARVQFCSQGGIDTINSALGSASSAQLYAAAISGILTTLVDVTEGEDVDTPAVISKRIDDMIKQKMHLGIFGAFHHRISDLTLASASSLVLRMLKSSAANATIITDFVFATDGESTDDHNLTMLLNAFRSCMDRRVEPIAAGLLIFMIGHLALDKEMKERIISKGVLASLVSLMAAHKKQRTIQEACLITLHMLSSGLPKDVHMMLPGYMGISVEFLEQEDEDEGADGVKLVKYEVLRRAALRKAFDLSSSQVGVLEIGQIVESSEQKVNHLGQTRIKTEKGWTSLEARDGGVLLVKKEDDDLGDKLQAKADEIVASLFVPLSTFADDEAVVESCFYAAKSLLSGSEMLKKAVARGGCLELIGEALSEHADVGGVATNGCETIGVLVANCKPVQKALKKTATIVPAIAKVLEIHTLSEPVIKSAFDCIEECTTSTTSGNTIFLTKLASAELDGVFLVDNILKEHKGANKDLLESGLKIRAKLAKFEEKKKDEEKTADTKDVGMGAGRRASLSIFAQPTDGSKKGKGGKSMDALEELQEDEEDEDDAFDVLNEMMNEMFEVKQSHIKKAPKHVQLQVGSMGLTFYDKDMKPVDNIMYQSLLSWKVTPKEVVLQVKVPGKEDTSDDVTLKCSQDTAQDIVKQMESQAAKLAAEHRARRKFKITQSHMKDEPDSVLLQVQDRAVVLFKNTDTLIQEIPFDELASWEVQSVRKNPTLETAGVDWELPAGGKQRKLLIFRTGDLPVLEFQSGKTSAIVDALETKAGPREVPPPPEEAEEGVPPMPDDLEPDIAAQATAAAAAATGDVDDDEDSDDEDGGAVKQPEAGEESDDEPDEPAEIVMKHNFTVSQSDMRGMATTVELKVLPTGLMLSESGTADSVVYSFSNLLHWTSLCPEPGNLNGGRRGKTLTVMVSAGAGLMTDYTFTTTEATMICASMEASACVAARTALNAKLPGAAASILDTGAGGIAEAELKAKLEALQEANKKFQEESGDADGSGGAVNSETLAALRETQTELRETKMRLETARSALELKEKEMTSKSGDSNTRIIELEQQLSVQTKAAQEGSASSDSKSAAATKALNEKLVKITAEMAGWKQKAEATEVTANRLKAAAAEGGEGGGGAVIAEMTEENEKLKAQVEKLTANGKMAIEKLQEKMKEAKTAEAAMEKMKKQRLKETAIVKRAMGELQNLRGQITKKDKEIKASALKMKKMMDMVATMKKQHATELEKLKLKAGDGEAA